jgi:toxin ParE1/3/4
MKLRYTGRAREDLDLAFSWYERQRRGLGFDFLDCVELSIKSIIEQPEIYALHYANFRGTVIRRFPFTIFFTIEPKEIVVHAVFDSRQDPEKMP